MPDAHFANPHSQALTAHYAALDAALHHVDTLQAELAWADSIDAPALKQSLAAAAKLQIQLAQAIVTHGAARDALPEPVIEEGLTATGAAYAAVGAAALWGRLAPGLAAVTIAMARSAARRAAPELRDPAAAERQRLTTTLADLRQRLAATEQAVDEQRATLARHAAIDRPALVVRLDAARAERDRAETALDQAVRDHEAAEDRLAPLVADLAAAEAAESEPRALIAAAEALQQRLAAADSKLERARIHAECTAQFGQGQPAKALEKLRSRLAGAERTTAKRRERLAYETRDAARVINHLVLDGSNLCFVGHGPRQRFHGLVALDALVPRLAERYRVTVVFDASMRKRLGMTKTALAQHFGAGIEVHVAAAARGADKTFLRYADAPTSYVISNDNMTDFKDRPVVKEGRVLGYEMLEGMVEVPVLNIAAHFA